MGQTRYFALLLRIFGPIMHDSEHEFASFEREEMPPLDMFEALADARGWHSDKLGEEELTIDYKGSWTRYQMRLIAPDDDPVVQLLVLPDLKSPTDRRAELYETLALINEQLWIGHFDLWSNNGVILFRHATTLPASGMIGVEQAQTMIDAAIEECERFYPVFQFVLWGGKTPSEAIESALIDTYGEA